MPELPDLTVYQEAIEARIKGEKLSGIRIASPFILRTVTPEASEFVGKALLGTKRIGKRIVLCFESDFYIVVHLMIAGRFQWYAAGNQGRGTSTASRRSCHKTWRPTHLYRKCRITAQRGHRCRVPQVRFQRHCPDRGDTIHPANSSAELRWTAHSRKLRDPSPRHRDRCRGRRWRKGKGS